MKFTLSVCLYLLNLTFQLRSQTSFSADKTAAFIDSIVSLLPPASVYFVGQLHNNQANALIEKGLLLSLNEQHSVDHVFLEYAHSAAFLVNEYLKSGDSGILKLLQPGAPFTYIKSVRRFNESRPADRQIRFWGIDFEGREDGRTLRLSLSIIAQYLRVDTGETKLYHLLGQAVRAETVALPAQLSKIREYVVANEAVARQELQERYLDLMLMVQAQWGFSPSRDRPMYQNFILLHRELTAVSSVEPRFLASFGTGHVNPENEKGIARLLQADKASPVKSSVSVIGVQYINCYFGKENSFKASEGMLTMICKKKATEVLDAVKLSEKRSLKWISATALSEVGCGSRATELAGMSLIAGFAATSPYFWQ